MSTVRVFLHCDACAGRVGVRVEDVELGDNRQSESQGLSQAWVLASWFHDLEVHSDRLAWA